MKSWSSNSAPKRILGLAMIVVGISCAVAQLAKGGAAGTAAWQAGTAATRAAAEMPRIENAKVETQAIVSSLDATFRELAGKADKPEWVAYSVNEIAGERSVCCGNYSDGAGCGTCRLEKEHSDGAGTTSAQGAVKLEGAANSWSSFGWKPKR